MFDGDDSETSRRQFRKDNSVMSVNGYLPSRGSKYISLLRFW
ncbi:Uncharacterised protein [Vibrio cholerae]|nr:Uncharacterised protein [Vibrio cholerae]CSI54168.1 Uncharacterised protein [Vibrio cholerae]